MPHLGLLSSFKHNALSQDQSCLLRAEHTDKKNWENALAVHHTSTSVGPQKYWTDKFLEILLYYITFTCFLFLGVHRPLVFLSMLPTSLWPQSPLCSEMGHGVKGTVLWLRRPFFLCQALCSSSIVLLLNEVGEERFDRCNAALD